MDLRDYARVLRKRWKMITACVLLCIGAAAVVSLLSTPLYAAKIKLFVSAQEGPSSASNAYQGGLLSQQRVTSYADIVAGPRVATGVIQQLKLTESPQALQAQITASAPLNTVLVNVSVTDASPQRAKDIANAVGQQFSQLVAQLEAPAAGGASPIKVSVVEPASLPTAPVSPKVTLNIALGLLLGLAVGVGAAVLRETLDTTVKSVEDVESVVERPVLGVINFDRDAIKRPLIAQADQHSRRAEAFRQLRTNLQFVNVDDQPRSIVITSSVPDEGKSTTAANLAITLAQAGVRVILVEADLRRPKLASYLGLEGAAGLTSVLIGQADIADVLQPWGDGGLLQVLPSGPIPPNPAELLGSKGLIQVIRQLEDACDLVIVDVPPLLPVTDGAVAATVVSGALLVVHSGATKRDELERANQTLVSVGARVLGVVLSMVPTKGPDAQRYGYGRTYESREPNLSPGQLRAAREVGQAARDVVPAEATGAPWRGMLRGRGSGRVDRPAARDTGGGRSVRDMDDAGLAGYDDIFTARHDRTRNGPDSAP